MGITHLTPPESHVTLARMITMNAAARRLKVAPTTILRQVERGLVKPKRIKTPLTGAGFVYDFTEADLAKLAALLKAKRTA